MGVIQNIMRCSLIFICMSCNAMVGDDSTYNLPIQSMATGQSYAMIVHMILDLSVWLTIYWTPRRKQKKLRFEPAVTHWLGTHFLVFVIFNKTWSEAQGTIRPKLPTGTLTCFSSPIQRGNGWTVEAEAISRKPFCLFSFGHVLKCVRTYADDDLVLHYTCFSWLSRTQPQFQDFLQDNRTSSV